MEAIGDLLFTAVGVLPAALTFSGYIAASVMLFMPLLITACLVGAYCDACAAAADSPQRQDTRTDCTPR